MCSLGTSRAAEKISEHCSNLELGPITFRTGKSPWESEHLFSLAGVCFYLRKGFSIKSPANERDCLISAISTFNSKWVDQTF